MDDLYQLAQETGNPVISGSEATFIWKGAEAPALVGDFTNWEDGPLELEMVDSGLWKRTVPLADDSYIEYAFWDGAKVVIDPLNVRSTDNGVDGRVHYFYMPRGEPSPLCENQRGVPAGKADRVILKDQFFVTGKQRTVIFYQPPVEEPCPLLVVFDGLSYFEKVRLNVMVENLLHQKRIQPLAIAFIESHDEARIPEYACSDATLAFLVQSVLPEAAQRLNLLPVEKHPGAYGILGASMGGLMAFYAGMQLPEIFGSVISQSGAFTVKGFETSIWKLLECQLPAFNLWMDVGLYEEFLDTGKRMHSTLSALGVQHDFRVYNAGHNYTSWRNDLHRGLEALFRA